MAKIKQIPGALLINAIYREMTRRGLTQAQTAELLGMGKSYLAALLTGARPLSGLGKDKIDALAQFLSVPAMQVRTMAEQIAVEEFFCQTTLDEELDRLRVRMMSDNLWCTFTPKVEAWCQLPQETRRLIGLLYEKLCQEELLTKAIPYRIVDPC